MEALGAALRDELAITVGSRSEATWILEHVAAQIDEPTEASNEARRLAARRAAGEPLQYVLGTWPFRTLELRVTPDALIPRPETEQLVEEALRRWREARPGDGAVRALDLGTGTGAIGLSLAVELRNETPVELWLTDVSPAALELAAVNAADARVDVAVREGSWFDALGEGCPARFHLIVANPPYVALEASGTLDPVLDHEPPGALYARAGSDGVAGFAEVEAILTDVAAWLAPSGVVAIEMAEDHVEAALALARTAGLERPMAFLDLAGRPRGLSAVGS